MAEFLWFIDDGFSFSKVCFENSLGIKINDVQYRVKHAVQSQNIFRHVVKGAERIGMRVNSSKTTMMCVLDAKSYVADAFIHDKDGCLIGCQENMKVLGMRFSRRPSMGGHIERVRQAVRQRYWTLRNLKNSGSANAELVYGAVVYHLSLTEEQEQDLERLQRHALKCIFGSEPTASELREAAGISTLRQRREKLCSKFATKLAANPLFEPLFPKKTTRASRRGTPEIYQEIKARCDRVDNSPLFYYRRILNGK